MNYTKVVDVFLRAQDWNRQFWEVRLGTAREVGGEGTDEDVVVTSQVFKV